MLLTVVLTSGCISRFFLGCLEDIFLVQTMGIPIRFDFFIFLEFRHGDVCCLRSRRWLPFSGLLGRNVGIRSCFTKFIPTHTVCLAFPREEVIDGVGGE